MTEISFLKGELILAVLWFSVRIIVWIVQRRIDFRREALLLLMYINLAVILRFTFYPMQRVNGRIQPLVFDPSAVYPFRINAIPVRNILRFGSERDLALNLIGNVAMFIPTGVILPVLYRRVNRYWKDVFAGAVLSLCIELLQLPFASRATDIDDLILNTLGAALGGLIFFSIRALRKKIKVKKNGKQKYTSI